MVAVIERRYSFKYSTSGTNMQDKFFDKFFVKRIYLSICLLYLFDLSAIQLLLRYVFGLWLISDYIATFFLLLQWKRIVKRIHCLERHLLNISQKAPIECHLCNKKLKSKYGYTLHLKNVLKMYMFHNRIKLKQFSRRKLLHFYQHLCQP